MSAPFDRVGDRYRNDPTFHAAVDMLRGLILDLRLTPSEIREAAMFACHLVEMRRPTGHLVIQREAFEEYLERDATYCDQPFSKAVKP